MAAGPNARRQRQRGDEQGATIQASSGFHGAASVRHKASLLPAKWYDAPDPGWGSPG